MTDIPPFTSIMSKLEDARKHIESFSTHYNLKNKKDFFKVAMEHRSWEKNLFKDDRMQDCLNMTRGACRNSVMSSFSHSISLLSTALGNFSYKYDAAFLDKLFRFMPTTFQGFEPIAKESKTPPYVSGRTSVRYIDLQPM